MKMERSEFVGKLALIAPALASSDLVPIMSDFCFSGDHVTAFNEAIAISVDLKTDFRGCVKGKALKALLDASLAKEVEFLPSTDVLKIKAARAHLDLATKPVEDFIFKMPAPKKDSPSILINEGFLDCLKMCMRSVGSDTQIADHLGVTIISDGGHLDFYSTNDNTISHTSLAVEGDIAQRFILPASFCRELLSVADPKEPQPMIVGKDFVLFKYRGYRLFGHMLQPENPYDFPAIITKRMSKAVTESLVKIPENLKLVLDRAAIMSKQEGGGVTALDLERGNALFTTTTPTGTIEDDLDFDEKHADVRVKFDPLLLRGAVEEYDLIAFSKHCIALTKNQHEFLMAPKG
jgi:DNA polymerase III sliding clamp (beta) subunit (PCNA family)